MSYFHNIDNLYVMQNESEKNNNQIVLFKTIKYNISDYSDYSRYKTIRYYLRFNNWNVVVCQFIHI